MKRNTERLIEELVPQVQRDADGSLGAIGVSPEQAVADLDRLRELIERRKPEEEEELEQILKRAPPPREGKRREAEGNAFGKPIGFGYYCWTDGICGVG